jgi:hypothetical protein
MLMTVALRFAPSATLAPLNYLEIVVSVVLGFLVFGDWPNQLTWAGIAVIVGSGLYVIQRERLASAARRERAAAPERSAARAGGREHAPAGGARVTGPAASFEVPMRVAGRRA